MNSTEKLDGMMIQFRVASRELFNHYFRVDEPYAADTLSWTLVERFGEIQRLLFDKMVSEPIGLATGNYGRPQERIRVQPRIAGPVPAMINREATSGYWDYHVKAIAPEAQLIFISFFDWDQLALRDNRYVRVQIAEWPAMPEAKGKHALVESNIVEFRLRET